MVLKYDKLIGWIIIFLFCFDIALAKDYWYEKIDNRLSDTLFVHQYGIVSLSTINIRKEPNQQSELVSQSMMGMPVKILNRNNKWLYIQTIDGYEGWTNYYSIKLLDNKEQFKNQWNSSSQYIFTDYFGIVRSLPDLHAPVVSDIVFNNIVDVTKKASYFYEIVLPNGKKGFIEKQKLRNFRDWISEQKYDTNKLIAIAQQFLGFPYSWGGASIKGMDCSSFIQLIFFQQGIVLPRDARLQIAIGKAVDTANFFGGLKVGDLLFFGQKEITHVAMYIGNQQYIHCFGEVKINSLDSTSKSYSKMLKNMLVKVKRLEENNISNFKITPLLYHFLEQ